MRFTAKHAVNALGEFVDRVVEALGRDGAFVSDESRVSDFLDWMGKPHRVRRHGGVTNPSWAPGWIEVPANPNAAAENVRRLARAVEQLHIAVEPDDLIVGVARRLRDFEQRGGPAG
jgi:hypothetical protein